MSELEISTDFLFAYRQSAGETPAIRWSRLHPRIAGVSPASGCTQPQMSEFEISTDFLFAYRQNAGETPAILIITQIIVQTNCIRDACVPSQLNFCNTKTATLDQSEK
ncbi:MAG: hypothetical protein LBP59_07720 [Planctomycetaceae bacterium]|jgi:hypothetical protein|nr:hypothetical protein [Planctomycetaceae bacterium]